MPFRSRKSSGTIDKLERELAEQERKLQEHIRELEQKIEEAPERAKARLRERREALVSSGRERVIRLEATAALPDRRFDDFHDRGVPARGGRLRSEQRADRIKFIALCIAVTLFLLFIITRI